MQAPQQQCHAAHHVEKNQASHQPPLSRFESKEQAIANRRRINLFVGKILPKSGVNALADGAFPEAGSSPVA
jgi:hypothetical protein